MKKWELTRYLIDAKKCIDSLLYINENFDKLINLDLREIIENKRRHFYINLCIIFDNSFSKQELKKIKNDSKIVDHIYYERDKNYAHKDDDYIKGKEAKLIGIIDRMKKELKECNEICEQKLPKEITIDYVSHDMNLFRYINLISVELENKIEKVLYCKDKVKEGLEYKVFDDTEDIREVNENTEYAVILKNGLTMKETLQNMQDAFIKINVLHNANMWVKLNGTQRHILDSDEQLHIKMIDEIRKSNI